MSTETRTLRVIKGNRRIGISAHQRLFVTETTPMGRDFGHQCRVTFRHRGKVRSLWAQHPNRLEDAEFNLGNGSGVDKIRVRFE